MRFYRVWVLRILHSDSLRTCIPQKTSIMPVTPNDNDLIFLSLKSISQYDKYLHIENEKAQTIKKATLNQCDLSQ